MRDSAEQSPYTFSLHGIKDRKAFELAYHDFIVYCKTYFYRGMFSTYEDGEPYFCYGGIELSYRAYKSRESEAQPNDR